MTLDELCECSADQLDKLTSEERTRILSPYFTVTRPELAVRERKTHAAPIKVDYNMLQGIKELGKLGIDATHLLGGRKK